MSRVFVVCTLLATLLSVAQSKAQTADGKSESDSASRYSTQQYNETPAQRQRQLREKAAQELVTQKAAKRASHRDERIALAAALGISHARPDYQRQYWFHPFLWSLPGTVWLTD